MILREADFPGWCLIEVEWFFCGLQERVLFGVPTAPGLWGRRVGLVIFLKSGLAGDLRRQASVWVNLLEPFSSFFSPLLFGVTLQLTFLLLCIAFYSHNFSPLMSSHMTASFTKKLRRELNFSLGHVMSVFPLNLAGNPWTDEWTEKLGVGGSIKTHFML